MYASRLSINKRSITVTGPWMQSLMQLMQLVAMQLNAIDNAILIKNLATKKGTVCFDPTSTGPSYTNHLISDVWMRTVQNPVAVTS